MKSLFSSEGTCICKCSVEYVGSLSKDMSGFLVKSESKLLLQILVGLWQGLICGLVEETASCGGNIGTRTPLEVKHCNENILLKADFQVCCKPF